MTGPYQPPGGDINSPFGPSDPTSPFPPSGDAKDESKSDEEASPYEGVQYELESPGGQAQPMTPPPPTSGPPGYRQPAPPPMAPAYAPQPTFTPMPPKKSSNNGLLIGGVIAGVVVLLLLAGIVIIVVAASASSENGGGSDEASSTYSVPSDVCNDVDLSPIESVGAFDGDPEGSSNPSDSYGYGSCTGSMGTYGESDYASFYLSVNTYDSVSSAESGHTSNTSTSNMNGCDTSDVSGSWAKGTLATGSGCGSPIYGDGKAIIAIQDENLAASIYIDCTEEKLPDAEDAVKSVAESLITASK